MFLPFRYDRIQSVNRTILEKMLILNAYGFDQRFLLALKYDNVQSKIQHHPDSAGAKGCAGAVRSFDFFWSKKQNK